MLAFWGSQLAGLVAVPVNTRFTEAEVASSLRLRRHLRFRPGEALPDGDPVASRT